LGNRKSSWSAKILIQQSPVWRFFGYGLTWSNSRNVGWLIRNSVVVVVMVAVVVVAATAAMVHGNLYIDLCYNGAILLRFQVVYNISFLLVMHFIDFSKKYK